MEGIQLYDSQGNGTNVLTLPVAASSDVSKIYSCAVKVLLQNWRQGTVGCKGRSEVAFSGKKPWRQKGTGRARAGMASSPLWRKGGVIFGPQPRVRTLTIPRKQRSLVLHNIFLSFYNEGKIKCLDFSISQSAPHTKGVYEVLKAAKLHDKKVVVFLSPLDNLHFASFRNIKNVRVIYFDQPNAYDLSCGESWIFLKKDMELFNKMVAKWNSVSTTS